MHNLAEFFGLVATIVAAAAFLYREIRDGRRESKEDLQRHIERTDKELQFQAERTDKELQFQAERMDKEIQLQREQMAEESKLQTQRSDKLYEMFIDLLKNPPPPKTHP